MATMKATERNAAIMEWLEAEPEVSYQTIGKRYGISRERVRQIVTRLSRENDRGWSKTARRATFKCLACGKTFPGPSSRRYCEPHTGKGYRRGVKSVATVNRICLTCGKSFKIEKSRLAKEARRGHRAGVYCSNPCRYKAMATRPILKRK